MFFSFFLLRLNRMDLLPKQNIIKTKQAYAWLKRELFHQVNGSFFLHFLSFSYVFSATKQSFEEETKQKINELKPSDQRTKKNWIARSKNGKINNKKGQRIDENIFFFEVSRRQVPAKKTNLTVESVTCFFGNRCKQKHQQRTVVGKMLRKKKNEEKRESEKRSAEKSNFGLQKKVGVLVMLQ